MAIYGLVGSTVLSVLAVHFWIADVVAKHGHISHRSAYLYSITLLVLLNGWRYWRIRKGTDAATNRIDQWRKK